MKKILLVLVIVVLSSCSSTKTMNTNVNTKKFNNKVINFDYTGVVTENQLNFIKKKL